MTFLGIDLGSSYIKGAVLDLDRLELRHVRRVPFPTPLAGMPRLFRAHDPYEVLSGVRELLNALEPHPEGIEGVVVCGQMHSLVFTTDRGEPMSNLTTWLDQRVLAAHPAGRGSYFDVLRERLDPAEIRLMGNELRPGLPIGLLFWLAEQGRLPGPAVTAASLPDFCLANLCGTVPTTDLTNAQGHGALNLATLDWHRPVLAKLGLERIRWPEIRPHGTVVARLPLRSGSVPCYTPVGDYQCAMVGALVQPRELSLNLSTGSQASLLRSSLSFGDFETRPYFDGGFANTISNIPAGRALNALIDLLQELARRQGLAPADPWDAISRALAEVEETDLTVNLAFFASSCGDRGAIGNLHEGNMTVGHLFRAALENIAENCYVSAQRLGPPSAYRSLVFSGGLGQKLEMLRTLIQRRFGRKVRVCPSPEDTLVGLLVLALVYSGRMPSVAHATAALLKRAGEGPCFVSEAGKGSSGEGAARR